MARLLFGLVVAAVIFTIYAVVDCAFFDRSRIRGLARGWWIIVIILLPVLGGVLWFLIGRGRRGSVPARPGRTVAPDDDLEFLRRLESEAAKDERIRRLEQELSDLDDGDNPRGDSPETPGTGRPNG